MRTHRHPATGWLNRHRLVVIERLGSAVRGRLGTGLLVATSLAMMSPPAALAQIRSAPVTTFLLSDRAWTSMTNGWGPAEKDRSNGEDAAGDGATLTLNGMTYPKGLGVHAPSEIRFALDGACSSLLAVVGVDDEKGTEGSVVFQVWTDGVKQYDSGLMTGSMPGASIIVSVLGATEIALIVTDSGDGTWSDHGDWADARVSCGGDTTVPTVTTTSPAAGASGMAVDGNVTGAFSEAMDANTLTPGLVTLIAQGTSTPVAATVTYDAASRTVTLNPTAPLAANTAYTATIKGGAQGATDLAGNPMAADKVWTTTTAAAAAASTEISPGEDIQARVNTMPPGTSFLLKTGLHRLQTISPRAGDTFTGEPGTVLSGARLLTDFTRAGAYWVASGQTQQGVVHGICMAGYSRCGNPEQLFLNDQLLTHVATLGEVSAGRWFFDYDADQIYFADDPTGGRVETSVTPTAFLNTANHVTITGLTVEKYANLAQFGPITAENTTGWVITDNEVRWNHGGGIRSGTGARIAGNHVHHNGQIGITGMGDDLLVENNEIAYNNQGHFDAGWEGGGTKFVVTNRLIVRGNFSHHNLGPGLWTDIDNLDTLYEDNLVEDNDFMGIFHEISWAAIIRNNTVRRNGFGPLVTGYIWGVGILVAASPNLEISGNVVENNNGGIAAVQQARGDGLYGPHEIANLYVHDNRSTVTTGWSGVVVDTGDTSYFTSRNTRFERNAYQLGSGGLYFQWMNGERTEAEWTGFGLDVGGTFAH
jgi:parallel beta-helix repeat protein